MRRWNGWGDDSVTFALPETGADYLSALIGDGLPVADASLEQVLESVPPSHAPAHPLITRSRLERLRHARGQSLPDWIALRSGRLAAFPDAVAFPMTDDDVRSLIEYALQTGVHLIPYGAGTSVVGHINPQPEYGPSCTVDMSRMDRLLELDTTSLLATFGAGVSGPALESQLQAPGYTLGHYPQSWEYSTLGGWIATRSSGQQSYHYGRIEELFAGGHVETPVGPLDLPPFPASGAGPDLRQLVLGSEGRLGLITRATVRIRPLPESETFSGFLFRDWESGARAVRELAQERALVSMLRLSDAEETETTLMLAGRQRVVERAAPLLSRLGYDDQKSLLVFGLTGRREITELGRERVGEISRAHGGLPAPFFVGPSWQRTRFLTPYLRNTLWDRGYAADTLETAVRWSAVMLTADSIKSALRGAMEDLGERVLAFAHLSHIYRDGAGIYVTYIFRRAPDPDETRRRWQACKTAASEVIVGLGGTISHQHGVGSDHSRYLVAEKGAVGMRILEAIRQELDPQGVMNPGKLL